tara:strand:+ start:255 stop:476 length:222 start_codon:yes stop_codon:yes gene_type:complete
MNEQDLKYMLATYQQRSADLFTQSIAHEAKIRQLTDLVNTLNEKVKEQEKEIEKLSKTKTPRTAKSIKDDSTF